MKALRQTVDLSAYPDLVVVYLGMTVDVLTGVKTLFGFGPKIEGSVAARPDGLLLHECQPNAPQTEKDLLLNANPARTGSVLAIS
jgi:hypothetical protein